jgi:hypothetical protein
LDPTPDRQQPLEELCFKTFSEIQQLSFRADEVLTTAKSRQISAAIP